MRELCWNGCLQFYTENYLFMSCLGWIGMRDLRFGSQFTNSENFSSVLAILLTIFSVVYPLFIAIFFVLSFKPLYKQIHLELEPGQSIDSKTQELTQKYGSVQNYYSKFHTMPQRKVFIETYGEWIQELLFVRLGKKVVLVYLSDHLQQFIILVAVLGLEELTSLAVFLMMYFNSVLLGLFVNVKPFNHQRKLYEVVFNLTALLYLSYLQLLMTEFVDQPVSDSVANQFLYATCVIIGVNLGTAGILILFKSYDNFRVWYRNFRVVQIKQRKAAFRIAEIIQNEKEQLKIIAEIKRRSLTLKLKPKKSILKKFDQENFDSLNRLVQEQKRIIQHPLFGNGIWSNQHKITFHQDVIFYRKFFEDSQCEEEVEENKFSQISKILLEIYPKDAQPIQKTSQKSNDQSHLIETLQTTLIQAKPKLSLVQQLELIWKPEADVKPKSDTVKLEASSDQIVNSKHPFLLNFKYNREATEFTNPFNWHRDWNYAFLPRDDSNDVSQREYRAYVEYLDTRMTITQWDKPPKFKNPILYNQSIDAYERRLEQINKNAKTSGVLLQKMIHFQTQELRHRIAFVIVSDPRRNCVRSKYELSWEIEQILTYNEIEKTSTEPMPVLNEVKLLKEIEEWENDNLEDIEKKSNLLQQDINNFKTENTFFSFSGLQSDQKAEEKNTFQNDFNKY